MRWHLLLDNSRRARQSIVHLQPVCQSKSAIGWPSAGQPHVAVGTSNVPLVLGLAAALLVAGKPVHLAHKEARIALFLMLLLP